jgi:hypothetical protein
MQVMHHNRMTFVDSYYLGVEFKFVVGSYSRYTVSHEAHRVTLIKQPPFSTNIQDRGKPTGSNSP